MPEGQGRQGRSEEKMLWRSGGVPGRQGRGGAVYGGVERGRKKMLNIYTNFC